MTTRTPLIPPPTLLNGALDESNHIVGDGLSGGKGAPLRQDVSPDRLRQIIKNKGFRVLWEQQTPCPNRLEGDQQRHNVNCRLCTGGRLYFAAKETTMLLSALSLQQNYFVAGRFLAGTAQVTPLAEDKINPWDRIKLLDVLVDFSELVRKQKSDGERLRFEPFAVTHALTMDGDTALQELKQGVDFTINGRTLEWLSKKKKPRENSFISIGYTRHPYFVIMDLRSWVRDTTVRRQGQNFLVDLPRSAMARLDMFVEDTASDQPAIPSTDGTD